MPRTSSPAIRRTIDAAPDLSCDARVIWLCPWCRGRNYTHSEQPEFATVCLRCERPVEVCCPE